MTKPENDVKIWSNLLDFGYYRFSVFCPSVLLKLLQNTSIFAKFSGGSAPLTPRRGSAPAPRWGLRPQTPPVTRPSARHAAHASLDHASLRSALAPLENTWPGSPWLNNLATPLARSRGYQFIDPRLQDKL